MSRNDDDAAWQKVVAASDPAAQRQQIDAFLALQQKAGAPALQVSVKDLASGQAAPISQSLWDQPQRYEVTLTYGDRSFRFVPRSRSSLEPLFRE